MLKQAEDGWRWGGLPQDRDFGRGVLQLAREICRVVALGDEAVAVARIREAKLKRALLIEGGRSQWLDHPRDTPNQES